jgi:hypothetical protein
MPINSTNHWQGSRPAISWGSLFEVRHGTRTSRRLPWLLRVVLHGFVRGTPFANFKQSYHQPVSPAIKNLMPTCLALVTVRE